MSKLAITTFLGTVAIAVATLVAAPAIADDPGANPAGKWLCLAAGASEISGQLTMTDTAYAFTQPGASSSAPGTYRIDRNVITLTSTLVAFFFGTMVNVLVKKSGKRKPKTTEGDATGPGREGILQRLRRRLRRGAKMKDE